MRKYWVLLSVALQDAFSERASALVWAFLDFLWPFANLLLWVAIYEGQKGRAITIGGFTLSQMLTYYLGVALISAVATAHCDWDVAKDIQTGELSLYLVRPLPYVLHQFLSNVAWKILKGLMIAPFLLLAFFLFRPFLAFHLSLSGWLVFLLSAVLAYLLYFFNAVIFGLFTFWVEEVGSFIEFNELVRSLFSGMAIPLSFLPGVFLTIGQILPYRYLYDFPLQIFTGRLAAGEILSGLAFQIFWLLVFLMVFRYLWRQGVARYSAFGG